VIDNTSSSDSATPSLWEWPVDPGRELWTGVLLPLLLAARARRVSRTPGLDVPGLEAWAAAHRVAIVDAEPLTATVDIAFAAARSWRGLEDQLTTPGSTAVVLLDAAPRGAAAGAIRAGIPGWAALPLPVHRVALLVPAERFLRLPEVRALFEAHGGTVLTPVPDGADAGATGAVDGAFAARVESAIAELRTHVEEQVVSIRRDQEALATQLADLRARLEEQTLDVSRAAVERTRLLRALADARAGNEVARAERDALRRVIDPIPDGAVVAPQPQLPPPPPLGPVTWPELPAPERSVQTTFTDSYGDLGDDLELALPRASDLRGVLVDEDGHPPGQPSIDVVICVHNALEDLRLCLWSLLHKSSRPFRLVLVDDGSDADTQRFLRAFAATNPAVTLVVNVEPPHGYTIAVNLGVRETTADYVVLLNSDTIVTFGWLERIVARGEAESEVGILGPLSNAASHQSVPALRADGGWATNPLPAWLTPDGMALAVSDAGARTHARLPFINGFCFVVKRAVIETVGEFDEEHFASGYCEENDYAQRARDAGFATEVVDDAYVFHAKSKSFGVEGRKVIAKRNYQIFLDKHGRDQMTQLIAGMEADPSLASTRAHVAAVISSPAAYSRVIAAEAGGPLSIAFILPGLGAGGSGGSHSIYQEVHGLRDLGVPARIALSAHAMDRARSVYDDADDVFLPFADDDELAEVTAGADVISATHNKSVAMLAALRTRRQDFLAAYYVQDYEPFFTQAESADVEEAIASYTAIDGMLLFAKTHWLGNVVARRHGLYVAKVEPSIDHEVYFPGPATTTDGRLRVSAMVRPRTPRRQPFSTVDVLERLAEAFPDHVDVRIFGCEDEALANVTRSSVLLGRNRGLLTRRDVADLLRETDVFLDMSMYQAFGRTALEAMACGATAVVPRIGGASEFARDGENALVVDTMNRDETLRAVASLVGDPDRLRALRESARRTAARYSSTRAALSEYVVFRDAYRHTLGR
jgi:GT2 family glycosyltransferase/glycosyltransferase involved in cell wall biosynthesis